MKSVIILFFTENFVIIFDVFCLIFFLIIKIQITLTRMNGELNKITLYEKNIFIRKLLLLRL